VVAPIEPAARFGRESSTRAIPTFVRLTELTADCTGTSGNPALIALTPHATKTKSEVATMSDQPARVVYRTRLRCPIVIRALAIRLHRISELAGRRSNAKFEEKWNASRPSLLPPHVSPPRASSRRARRYRSRIYEYVGVVPVLPAAIRSRYGSGGIHGVASESYFARKCSTSGLSANRRTNSRTIAGRSLRR